jgi:predicted DNA-binding transcriptional regulator YafY
MDETLSYLLRPGGKEGLGRRSATETAIVTLAAFLARTTWEQSALAREVGVQVRALRRIADELVRCGVKLERSVENGRLVYWSVPKNWVPRGAVLSNAQASACVRFLARLPKSETRDDVIRALVGPAALAFARADRDDGEVVLAVLEDAQRGSRAARIWYESTSTKRLEPRLVSVHHIAHGSRPRFVATCHRRDRLLWFRVDRVHRAEPCGTEPYRRAGDDLVRAFVAGSADGFSCGAPVLCRFWVRAEDAAWVRGNLPVGEPRCADGPDGTTIEVETAGVEVLARFVVGLGRAAKAETPELAARVRELALGALEVGGREIVGTAAERGAGPRKVTGQNRAGRSARVGGRDG